MRGEGGREGREGHYVRMCSFALLSHITLLISLPPSFFLVSGQRFDVVVSSEVIEHVTAPAAFVKSLAAMLAEEGEGGGHVVLTTINRTAKAYLLAILGAEHIARMVPNGKILFIFCFLSSLPRTPSWADFYSWSFPASRSIYSMTKPRFLSGRFNNNSSTPFLPSLPPSLPPPPSSSPRNARMEQIPPTPRGGSDGPRRRLASRGREWDGLQPF